MHRHPAATPSDIAELSRCSAVFVPADPARTGRIAFWNPDGNTPTDTSGALSELTVVGADLRRLTVPALCLPVRDALPVLTRARAVADASPAIAFWGAAALLALQLLARGLLLPGLSRTDHDAWRIGPLSAEDLARVRELAASMPPTAHATPVPDEGAEQPVGPG
ncbi:ATP-dependent helicase, partial [Streptomyces anulatus]|nr:ATP-dependent helicase [Streptomyces anulatus]